jgi:hypothetical protein
MKGHLIARHPKAVKRAAGARARKAASQGSVMQRKDYRGVTSKRFTPVVRAR